MCATARLFLRWATYPVLNQYAVSVCMSHPHIANILKLLDNTLQRDVLPMLSLNKTEVPHGEWKDDKGNGMYSDHMVNTASPVPVSPRLMKMMALSNLG